MANQTSKKKNNSLTGWQANDKSHAITPDLTMKARMNTKLNKAIASCVGNSSVKSWLVPGIAASMMVSSQLASALGLGVLDVQSNLDQPLRGIIEVRTNAGDDLASVVAKVASREDYDSLGIDYPEYAKNLSLKFERQDGGAVIRVSSDEVVLSEPFVHFLVRVEWSGGSFLREYTALIDPPVYSAAEAPATAVTPESSVSEQSYQPDPEPVYEPEVDSNDVVAEPLEQDSVADEVEEPVSEEVASEDDQPLVEDDFYEDTSAVEEATQESVPDASVSSATDARYGPVTRGETLSTIARDLQSQVPDLSVYSIMKVLFDENPNAFISGNINGLMEGAVLNLGDLNAIRAADVAEAKQFFRSQVEAWDPGALASSADSDISVAQDNYSGTDTFDSDYSSDGDSSESFQVGSSEETDSFVSSSQSASNEGEVIALKEEISQLQSSLASSQLENQELTERISMLERQLEDVNRLMSLNVEDAGMAEVESNLANQSAAEEALDDEVDEVVDSVEQAATELVDDVEDGVADLADEAESVFNDVLDESADAVDDGLSALDDGMSEVEDQVDELASTVDESTSELIDDVEEVVSEEVEEIAPEPVVSSQSSSSSSFMDKISDFGGMKLIGGVGALFALGLGLFFWRRRQADEEFEISMLSIASNSHTIDTATASGMSESITASESVASKSQAGNSVSTNEGGDKETSFLTVYSDSDAVVQADEVDPIAEADVYIAYGRDEQAEEVLLDGISTHPDRIDVKRKLLELYHKTKNAEGFERVAEELYSQRDSMSGKEWQEISDMGKEVAPKNPLFSVSGDDYQQVDQASENVVETATDKADDNDEVSGHSEMVADSLNDGDSVQLIDFDDGRSEVSALDEVEIDAISSGNDDTINLDDISSDDDSEELSISEVQEVSDLEISEDYDEARTQYELAKVFVDLGDNDGARKILDEIVADSSNDPEVLKDAQALLDSMDA